MRCAYGEDCAGGGFSTIRPPRAQNEELALLVEEFNELGRARFLHASVSEPSLKPTNVGGIP